MGIDLGRFKSNKDDAWLDWLTDDPIPASIRARLREKAVRQSSRPVVRRVGGESTTTAANQPASARKIADPAAVSINITIPKFKKPSVSALRKRLPANIPYKKVGLSAGSLVFVLGIGLVAINVRHHKAGHSTDGKGVLSASDQKPPFPSLTPSGDSASPTDKKYDPMKKVVSYTDTIGGVKITVSQQQLPGGFQDNPQEKVKKLAEDFSATDVLSTANPTAYLGTSAKGPQTVIFTKNGLLIFMQSATKIDNHDWASYITSMKL